MGFSVAWWLEPKASGASTSLAVGKATVRVSARGMVFRRKAGGERRGRLPTLRHRATMNNALEAKEPYHVGFISSAHPSLVDLPES